MVSKRDYLIEKGILSADRKQGRWPAAAHKAIEDAINAGVKFGNEDRSAGIGNTAAPRHDRPEGMYVFQNPDGRKFERLHTNACVKCSYSFRWCACENGPFQWQYLSGNGQYAELLSMPKAVTVATVTDVSAPRRRGRGRPRKAAA